MEERQVSHMNNSDISVKILYSLKVEIEEEDEIDDEIDSARSIRMEMVEVIKLKMSLDMPESKSSLLYLFISLKHLNIQSSIPTKWTLS